MFPSPPVRFEAQELAFVVRPRDLLSEHWAPSESVRAAHKSWAAEGETAHGSIARGRASGWDSSLRSGIGVGAAVIGGGVRTVPIPVCVASCARRRARSARAREDAAANLAHAHRTRGAVVVTASVGAVECLAHAHRTRSTVGETERVDPAENLTHAHRRRNTVVVLARVQVTTSGRRHGGMIGARAP